MLYQDQNPRFLYFVSDSSFLTNSAFYFKHSWHFTVPRAPRPEFIDAWSQNIQFITSSNCLMWVRSRMDKQLRNENGNYRANPSSSEGASHDDTHKHITLSWGLRKVRTKLEGVTANWPSSWATASRGRAIRGKGVTKGRENVRNDRNEAWLTGFRSLSAIQSAVFKMGTGHVVGEIQAREMGNESEHWKTISIRIIWE